MKLINQYLKRLETEDNFHHLGFNTASIDVKSLFGDVKIVCLSGSVSRITKFAKYLNDNLQQMKDDEIVNLCSGDRYVMYKVGHVLVANHGMGVPSASIILHELFKLLHYAGTSEVIYFRIGTSGGLGVEPGTVILTEKAVNGALQPKHTQLVLGKTIEHSTVFNHDLAMEVLEMAKRMDKTLDFPVQIADTMCCDDFYEGQARLDGALCTFTEQERDQFLNKAHEQGVRNIEMESLVFASMCNRVNVKACIICVVYLDRLSHDQIKLTSKQKEEYERRPWHIVLEYIKKHLKS